MRFEAKFDRWIVALWALTPILLVVMTVRDSRAPGSRLVQSWLLLFGFPIVMALFLARMLPQYYELREDGLFVRQGWTDTLIPYEFLVAADPYHSLFSSRPGSDPVFSMDRIRLVTNGGRRYVIAVAEEKRFLSEIWKRCPQLNPATASQIPSLIERQASP